MTRVADEDGNLLRAKPNPTQVRLGQQGICVVEVVCSCGTPTTVAQTLLWTGRSVRCASCSSRVKGELVAAANRARAREARQTTPASSEDKAAAKLEAEAAARQAEEEALRAMEVRQAAARQAAARDRERARYLELRRNGLA